MKNATWTEAARNTMLDAIAPDFNSGYLRLYDLAAVMLAELQFNATAFPAASGGTLTANAITSDSDAAASGTAATFKCFESDGVTELHGGTVGTSDANAIVATTSIVQHAEVSCSFFEIPFAATSAQ